MNWHARYLQQAAWTRDLQNYIFDKAGIARAKRILEVGCGTGAVIGSLPITPAARHGLDLDFSALISCKTHTTNIRLTQADGLNLPYANQTFDIAYCHYFLLWTKNPMQAVKEMARVSRWVIAFAEPDYSRRTDELGRLQIKSLRGQGANPLFGNMLAETFFRAGITIEETGEIRGSNTTRISSEEDLEWDVIESDLGRVASREEIEKIKIAYAKTRDAVYVPTFFAWGKSEV